MAKPKGSILNGQFYENIRQDKRGWYVYDDSLPRNQAVVRFGKDPIKAERRIIGWMRERAKRTGQTFSNVPITARLTTDLAQEYIGADHDDPTKELLALLGMSRSATQAHMTTALIVDGSLPPTMLDEFMKADETENGKPIQHVPLDLTGFWQRLGMAVRRDVPTWAERLGIPELREIPHVTMQEDKTLAKMIDDYRQANSAISEKELTLLALAWKRFRKGVRVYNLSEVRQAQIDRFFEYCQRVMKRGIWNYGSACRMVRRIRTVLEGSANLENPNDRCLAVSRMLREGMKKKSDRLARTAHKAGNGNGNHIKQIVTREQFQALLSGSKDKLLTALIHLGANIGAHLGELCALPASAIDLDKGVLDMIRTKTSPHGIRHMAPLWDETVKAIRLWQESDDAQTVKHDGTALLFSRNGKSLDRDNEGARFLRLKRRLGLDMIFDNFRDTVATLPKREPYRCLQEDINLVMGHASNRNVPNGQTADHYWAESLDGARSVTDALHAHYFGENKKSPR